MHTQKKFAFDVGITLIASVISMLIGFVITILLGRYLGAGDLGLYRMVFTIYGIAMLFTAIGIPAAIIKYVAEFKDDEAKSDAIVSSGVITSLIIGIVFSMLFYFSSGIFEVLFNMPELSRLLKILSPVFPFALVGGALLGLLNGRREMKRYGAATILQSVLMLVVSVSLIYCGFGVAGVVIGVVISSVGWCLYLLLITRDYFEITFEGYADNTKTMLGFGVQIFGVNAINMINYQADIILIGYFLTATDVGYYAVAVGLSKFFWLIPQAIQTITYPATSEYWSNNNHSALQIMIDKSMKYTACVLFPVGLGVGFFSKEIITLIFGDAFIHAVLPLQILVMGTVVFGVVKAIGGSVTGMGRPDIGLKIVGISATTNVVLNLLLIPIYGISGAAVATAISLFVAALLNIFITIRMLNLKIDLEWYAKMSGMTLLAILVFVYNEHVNVYLLGLTLLGFYLIAIFTNLLTGEDWTYFMKLIRRS
jgi:O-antigen/teichoic acid export membrane protein